MDMLDNSFQTRYNRLPIATYAITELPHEEKVLFCHKHHHKEFEVLAVTGGDCEFVVDGAVCQGNRGDIFFVPPYATHMGFSLPGESFSYFCFSFDLSILKEAEFAHLMESGHLDIRRVVRASEPICGELYGVIQSIFQQSDEHRDHWDFIVRGQLLHLFGLLWQSGRICPAERASQQSGFGLDVLDILRRSYSEDITSANVAAELSYSQSYFCRKFRETFSLSFREYLSQYRLSKARLFLTQDNLTVGEIAEKVGYNSVSFFIRQFHSLYGCTPGQFQKNQRAGHPVDMPPPIGGISASRATPKPSS